MRYGAFVLTPDRGWFSPKEAAFRRHGVTTVAIHNITLLADGTAVLLHELNGDGDDILAALGDVGDDVVDYQLDETDEATMLRCHYHPTEIEADLLGLLDEHAVLLDYPLSYTDPARSSLKVTLIAEESTLRTILNAVPAGVAVDVLRIGSYELRDNHLFTALTERKQEVVRTAVQKGYYETPRQATCEDIAAELDCSPGTVAEHLRLAESTLLTELVPATYDGPGRESPRPITQS
ncbi:MAG: helix-turn-helix domain-containing protein [Haloarculaceae archaeon]